MFYRSSQRFDRELSRFAAPLQDIFAKQLAFLLTDLRHPSLRAKKYDESEGIWQARVTHDVRFYFVIHGDTYILLNIRKHGK
jgi:hypothetical protein